MDTITHWVTHYGYAGIFALLVLGIFGIPLPDETLLMFAGYLAYKGELQLVPTIGSAVLGSICGISVSYGLGRTIGLYLVTEYGHFVHVTPEKVERVRLWFDRVGRWCLLFGYFIPGVRHLTAFVAGASKLRGPEFAVFAYGGAFLWASTFVLIGYLIGKDWMQVSERIHRHILVGSGIALALIVFLVFFSRWRNR